LIKFSFLVTGAIGFSLNKKKERGVGMGELRFSILEGDTTRFEASALW
jgi:hypothetical protein